MDGNEPNPVLCCTTRSGLVEMTHRGVFCCVKALPGRNHEILFSAGNIEQLFYPRSSMKFVQVLPVIETGAAEYFDFTDVEIAVMCSSHNAEPEHIAAVRSILHKAGLSESQLACGGHTPISEAAAFQYVREGIDTPFKDHIYNNCSGKHAGFLAVCKYMNFPVDNYLNVMHPVQQLTLDAICDLFELDKSALHVGLDGCSAPTVAVNARQAALAFARLCQPPSMHFSQTRAAAIQRVLSAVSNAPSMVYGTNGFCTELMTSLSGRVVGKRGAAGVYFSGAVGLSIGCAVKIDDGTMGPQYNVTMHILRAILTRRLSNDSAVASGEGVDYVREEDHMVETGLAQLEKFFVTPCLNSMGRLVGHTACCDSEGRLLPALCLSYDGSREII